MSMLLVITGASRGLGKAIALEFCGDKSLQVLDMVLISRNENLLQQTQLEIQQANAHCHVRLCIMDLGDLQDLEARVEEQIMKEMDNLLFSQPTPRQPKCYDRFVFINNAGSLGHIGPSIQTPSLMHMQQNINLNVTAACWLSARMAKWADEHTVVVVGMSQGQGRSTITATTIVNISSLVAVQAFPSMALYSAGKAARDQYHVAMAKELVPSQQTSSTTRIRTLNYAPGPLETDMTHEIRQAPNLNAELKPHYQKKLIDPRDSAARLVKLIMRDDQSFQSGQHVDYYDLDG